MSRFGVGEREPAARQQDPVAARFGTGPRRFATCSVVARNQQRLPYLLEILLNFIMDILGGCLSVLETAPHGIIEIQDFSVDNSPPLCHHTYTQRLPAP